MKERKILKEEKHFGELHASIWKNIRAMIANPGAAHVMTPMGIFSLQKQILVCQEELVLHWRMHSLFTFR